MTRSDTRRQALEARMRRARASDLRTAITSVAAMDALATQTLADTQTQPLAGLVGSVKACFDVRGWVTHAGSRALAQCPAATQDAVMVAAMRRLGVAIALQTNMTEFAYGALGTNATYGTPLNPLPAYADCVAGGSSSGAAVSVATQLADVALASDTSGSARIPAAFCGIVGFIPTQGIWPSTGMLGLAPSFDTPGIMTRDAASCQRVAMALNRACKVSLPAHDPTRTLAACTFLVPDHVSALIADAHVARSFATALTRLQAAGARIVHAPCPPLIELNQLIQHGQINAVEAYLVHKDLLPDYGQDYEPLIRRRIEAGQHVPAHVYAHALFALAQRRRDYAQLMPPYDAVLTPSVSIRPPRVAALADEARYLALNQQVCTFTEYANALGVPSVTVPIEPAAPLGMLLTGKAGHDEALLHLACLFEQALRDPG